ncbi:NAD(P)/FAD-dependent oxidoreductase [Aureliella helgolandensis]|uniref:D-amino acid dehydrogenase small subunit n=1 Tax=Aureliella helgolandensis TaxID=2527968 RepID=A0A518G7B0_9BACT|nr:FAD-dependent oxidoreductase [Aureliella helgolandensis]QDV24475.1 D-amino acid dehydrogenase small subunit [Aureliella helgolandensis]
MGSRGHIVVVGGGIIGVTSAWYLSRDGWQVTVIDQGEIGRACSYGNCGLVCPSHVLPLTEPGAFKAALTAMLTPNSPFRIQPRLDPALWSWLWNFAKRCNKRSMLSAAHAIQALLTSTLREYEWLVSEQDVACEWQKKGLLFPYLSPQAFESYAATNSLLTEVFQEPARKLSTQQAIELEPTLKDSIAGAWFYEHDAHLRPDRLIASLQTQVEQRGGAFLEQCKFKGLQTQEGRIDAIETSHGILTGDRFLFATGAWAPMLNEHLGCKIPIQPGKGYSITMPRPNRCPNIPMIFPEHRVAVTPMLSGYRLGSIMEFVGYDESIRPERLELLRTGAQHYLHEPLGKPELETWYGWRPMTYDGLPVIDRSPRWNNAWVAAGHNMLGLTLAPVTARLVTELIGAETPHLDPTPYGLARFQ